MPSDTNRLTRPAALELDREAVPEVLCERDQWVAWCYTYDDDREEWTKVPVDASAGCYASSTDPDTWTTFANALAYHDRGDTNTDGIGFVVHGEDLVVGIDLDDCRDPETGDLDPWAAEFVETVSTYAEVSPSGTGLRLFGLGFVPDGGTRSDIDGADGHLEMYESGRYLTVTGHRLEDAPEDVRQVNDEIANAHAEHIVNQGSDAGEREATDGGAGGRGAVDLDDEELLERARNAQNGEKFEQLWRGSIAGYPSPSEADLALCGLLAFWTGGDRQRMDELFRRSGLMRDKWDEKRASSTYGEQTIEEALDGRSDFYEPNWDADDGRKPEDIEPPNRDTPFTPEEIAVLAGVESVSDLNDRERAYWVTHEILMSDDVHVLAAQPDGTLFRYDDGVWTPTGDQLLREVGHRALRTEYGSNTHGEMCEQIRARRPVDRDELGTPARTVAVANGLLHLETRELTNLEPEHYALTQLPVEFDPGTEATRWEQFIDEVVEPGRREAIQEYVGYTLLVGELPIHRALMLVGEGSNGKSTFLRVVKALLGEDNITAHPLQGLAKSEHNVADLYGTVANICADLSSRGIGDGGMFKTLVGGDTVTGRRLYQEPFSFEATAKQLYSANQVPDVEIDDEAFFRRWLLVEFPTQFTDPDKPGPDKDPGLTDELLEELPGVLNWALDGLDRLREQGHFTGEGDPLDKRDRWMSWGDSISKFIDECVDTDADGKWRTGEVHARYAAWCRQELGEEPEAQQTLTKELKKCEGVQYGNYRFDGSRDRGLKGFTLADDVPAAHDAAGSGTEDQRDPQQASLTQGQAISTVLETTRELEADRDGPVPVDDVVDTLDMSDDRARHFLEKLLQAGELYAPETGTVRTP